MTSIAPTSKTQSTPPPKGASQVPTAKNIEELKAAGGFGGRPDPRGFLTPGMGAWTVNPNEPLPADPQLAQMAGLQRALELDSKYFTFTDDKSGVHGFCGFHTLGPRTPTGILIAYVRLFDPQAKEWKTCTDTIPLKDIAEAFNKGRKTLELPGGKGGIELLGPNQIKWSYDTDAFGFSFVAKANQMNTLQLKPTLDPIQGDLLGVPALNGVQIPPSEYTWSPMMLQGTIEKGSVRVGPKKYTLDGASAYHEESKGGWFPGERKHGYHFFNMSGRTADGQSVVVELGNFHSSPRAGELSSLTVVRNGCSQTYGAADFKVTFDREVQSAAHKDPWAEKMGVYTSSVAAEDMNKPGPNTLAPHPAPTHFKLETNDGTVIEGNVDAFQSITAAGAGANGFIPGNWSLDEGHASGRVSFRDGKSIPIKGETELVYADRFVANAPGAPVDGFEA